jgi:hypothetical protein
MDTRSLMLGAAAGSALMFMLDPDRGGRRRALVRDQAVRATRKTRDGVDATVRDIANRAGGVTAAVRGRWSSEGVTDETLIERVRAKIGRVCTHPHAIDVDANGGEVTLSGPVLASEVHGILSVAAAVRGVQAVHNELESYETAEGIPALQGEGRLAGPSLDILQPNWAPATRALVSAGLLATGVWMALHAARGSNGGGMSHAPM